MTDKMTFPISFVVLKKSVTSQLLSLHQKRAKERSLVSSAVTNTCRHQPHRYDVASHYLVNNLCLLLFSTGVINVIHYFNIRVLLIDVSANRRATFMLILLILVALLSAYVTVKRT